MRGWQGDRSWINRRPLLWLKGQHLKCNPWAFTATQEKGAGTTYYSDHWYLLFSPEPTLQS